MEETGISIDPSSQIAHVQNFFDCIRSGQRPAADVEIGYKTITACHLAVIAYKTETHDPLGCSKGKDHRRRRSPEADLKGIPLALALPRV